MTSMSRQGVRSIPLCVFVALLAALAASVNLSAQTHVVSSDELRQQVMATTQARESNIQEVTDFLSLPKAEKAMRAVHVDPNQVKSAMATLSDQELAQLAARAEKAQAQFAAGDISDRDLLFIIAGVAVLVLIIVAVR